MAMINIEPSTGPRIPSLVSLACQSFAFGILAAVDRQPNPGRFWKDETWKAFRLSLQVTLSIKEGLHSGKWHGQVR
jgi:hypothetical protein